MSEQFEDDELLRQVTHKALELLEELLRHYRMWQSNVAEHGPQSLAAIRQAFAVAQLAGDVLNLKGIHKLGWEEWHGFKTLNPALTDAYDSLEETARSVSDIALSKNARSWEWLDPLPLEEAKRELDAALNGPRPVHEAAMEDRNAYAYFERAKGTPLKSILTAINANPAWDDLSSESGVRNCINTYARQHRKPELSKRRQKPRKSQ
jgi:hypothetical protein